QARQIPPLRIDGLSPQVGPDAILLDPAEIPAVGDGDCVIRGPHQDQATPDALQAPVEELEEPNILPSPGLPEPRHDDDKLSDRALRDRLEDLSGLIEGDEHP